MEFRVPDYIRSLVPYVPGKPIEETQRELGLSQVVKLASNENALGPSPAALEAIRRAVHELHRYPDSAAYTLKRKLASHLAKAHSSTSSSAGSAKITPDSILVGNGSNEVIDLLIRTFCVAGDRIVTSQAAFIAYRLCAQIHGVKTMEAPLTEDSRFDLPEIARLTKEDERARMIFIANPNNPTGTYVTTDEMKDFLREISTIRDRSVLVVLDYAYWEYVSAPDLPDPIALQAEFPNVVVLRTFSKIYGLAGLRVGYAVADANLLSYVERVRQPFNMNALALFAAEAALDDVAFLKDSLRMNSEGMAFWEKRLNELNIPYLKSQGNFLLVDVRKGLGLSGPDVYASCLKEGVIFRPVANYGMPDALRISLGTPEENQIAADVLSRMKNAQSE